MSNEKKTSKPQGPRGMGGAAPVADKANDFKGSIGKLIRYIGPYKYAAIGIVVFSIISTVISLFGPKVQGMLITEIGDGFMDKVNGGAGIDFDRIQQIAIFLLGIYVASALVQYLSGFLTAYVNQKITYKLRTEMTRKINRLPISYFDKQPYGEVLSHFTNDVDTISMSFNQLLNQAVSGISYIIGSVIMMLTINGWMTLAILIVLPLTAVFAMMIMKSSQKYFVAQQTYLGHVNGQIEEIYSGHNVVKLYNGEAKASAEFKEMNDELYKSAWKSQFFSGLMQPIAQFVGNLGYVLVCILGGYFAIDGTVKIGDITSFMTYVRMFNQNISQIANVSNVVQSTAAAAERVFAFLEEEEETPNISDELAVKAFDENGKTLIKGDVAFENVKFGYTEDRTIINDFSAIIGQGKKVAIVGPTGAGKTTIVKLLLRFYELNGGAIYVDNHDITEFKREDLRAQFGMVLQDAWLFKGTIMENLRFGNFEASDEEVIEAAKAARVDHFIRTLEQGYDTVIDEDSDNISQGQKQLLTIARAFLKDPKILILDEATSSVDTRTEVLIQEAMDTLMVGRTSFVIAHRLSTIRNADLILVMKDGDIVEVGDHDELLAKDGFYAQLYNSQFDEEEE